MIFYNMEINAQNNIAQHDNDIDRKSIFSSPNAFNKKFTTNLYYKQVYCDIIG